MLLLAFCAGCATTETGSGTARDFEWGPVVHGMQAQVSTYKSEFQNGEEIIVIFRVRNASDRPVAIPSRLQMFYSNTHLQYESEPATGLIGQAETPKKTADFLVLHPGQTYTFPHDSKAHELHKHTGRPGSYTFWSTPSFCGPNQSAGGDRVLGLDVWTGLLQSNRICFEVSGRVERIPQAGH